MSLDDELEGTILHATAEDGLETSADVLTKLAAQATLARVDAVRPEDLPEELVAEHFERCCLEADALDREDAASRARIIADQMKRFVAEKTLIGSSRLFDDSRSVEEMLEQELGDAARLEALTRLRIGS